ncbi:uncharacterized protein AAES06_009766 isoform 2-T3 [Glossophaga mutica]
MADCGSSQIPQSTPWWPPLFPIHSAAQARPLEGTQSSLSSEQTADRSPDAQAGYWVVKEFTHFLELALIQTKGSFHTGGKFRRATKRTMTMCMIEMDQEKLKGRNHVDQRDNSDKNKENGKMQSSCLKTCEYIARRGLCEPGIGVLTRH